MYIIKPEAVTREREREGERARASACETERERERQRERDRESARARERDSVCVCVCVCVCERVRGRLNCGCRTSGSTKAGVLSAVLVCAGTAPSSTMPIKTTPSALTERMAGRSTNTERNGLHVLLHEILFSSPILF